LGRPAGREKRGNDRAAVGSADAPGIVRATVKGTDPGASRQLSVDIVKVRALFSVSQDGGCGGRVASEARHDGWIDAEFVLLSWRVERAQDEGKATGHFRCTR